MSRTHKGSKGPGFDYWSKRGHGYNSVGVGYGKYPKQRTLEIERMKEREIVKKELDEFVGEEDGRVDSY